MPGERRHGRRVQLSKLTNQARDAERAPMAEMEALMAAHDAVKKR